jgi:hypothetical protein
VTVQVVSFSGGRTSAYLCSVLLGMFDRADLRFVFMDTGAEHPATYDFIRKVDGHLGLNLVCLRGDCDSPLGVGVAPRVVPLDTIGPDLQPFASMCGKYGTPGVRSAWCTSRLKEDVNNTWCNEEFGKGGYVTWIGVRADEPKRLKNMGRSPLVRYLAEVDDADKQDIYDFWSDMPFDLEIPQWLGNCVFCIKKSNPKLALAVRQEPKMAAEWSALFERSSDRHKTDGLTSEHVYRERRTLAEVAALYADVETPDLIRRIRSARRDPNTCSESCEAFVSDDAQLWLFAAGGLTLAPRN